MNVKEAVCHRTQKAYRSRRLFSVMFRWWQKLEEDGERLTWNIKRLNKKELVFLTLLNSLADTFYLQGNNFLQKRKRIEKQTLGIPVKVEEGNNFNPTHRTRGGGAFFLKLLVFPLPARSFLMAWFLALSSPNYFYSFLPTCLQQDFGVFCW